MATRTMVLVVSALLFITILVPLNSGFAQNTDGRWALGFHGGANMWFNDYDKVLIGPGGEVMVRYGMTPTFSGGILLGYEELKAKNNPPISSQPYNYLKLHAMPAALAGWFHFAPGKNVNPYVYVGIGAVLYKRLTAGDVYVPDSKFSTSILVPVGVGLEMFASRNASIVADLGYRVTDDYLDAIKTKKLDGYATAKVGVNFYFGTSNAEKEERVKAAIQRMKDSTALEAQRMKELADAEALRVKTLADANALRVKDSTDAEARRMAELSAKRLADTVLTLQKGKTIVLKGVNFETNKATLTKESETTLELAYNALIASPNASVLIVGHTDNVGKAAYNKKLSLHRAQAVKSWLVRKGIAGKRLTVAGKGLEEPIDENTTPEGRSNNRRIEFRVLK